MLMKNSTTHIAGTLGYIESPVTTVKPPHYGKSDLITLILSVVHTYEPALIEPINVLYRDMIQTNNSIEETTQNFF